MQPEERGCGAFRYYLNVRWFANKPVFIAPIASEKSGATDLEAQLARARVDLEQFVCTASHDLQEPLRMISSYLQLLDRRYSDRLDADGRDFIRYAVEGAARMKNLLEDLLRVARAGTQAAEFRPARAGRLLEFATDNLRNAITQSGALITSDPLPSVIVDSGLIAQVFQNLIANAIKFHAPGVTPRIHISAECQGSQWIFSVADNGIGIEARHQERIFQPFERLHTPEEYPGSGVGLAITRKILERHGGRVWIESTLGGGSTFLFSLPTEPLRNGVIPDSELARAAGRS